MTVSIRGARDLPAPREVVWAALNAPDSLRRCIPGCRSVERRSATVYAAEVVVRLGPVAATFDGTVEVVDAEPPAAFGLRGRGGGVLGRVTGTTRIVLAATPGGCRLSYSLEAMPSGPIALLGPFVLTALANAMTDRFARALAGEVEGAGAHPGVPDLAEHPSAPSW